MNSRDPRVREEEMVASPLQSYGGQTISNETYAKARELRRWIAAHPASAANQMPEGLRDHLWFLLRKKLVTFAGVGSRRRFTVRPV